MGVLTKKETMENIFNEFQDKVCRNEIDIQFFKAKALNFKKNSPDYKANMDQVKVQEANLFWNSLLLKTIKKLII